MKLFHILVIFVLVFGSNFAIKLPSYFKICKLSDPDLENCFARAIEHALPYLKEPIPELKIPSIEPLRIESVTIEPGTTGLVNITQKLTNIVVHKSINSKVKKTELSVGLGTCTSVIYLYNNHYITEANYEVDGTIIGIPLTGKGKGVFETFDVNQKITLNGVFYEKKNKSYVKLDNVDVDLNPGKVTFKLDNLFNGNKNMENEVNKLLDDNWEVVFGEIKGVYEQVLEAYYKSVFGAIYNRISFNELFPV